MSARHVVLALLVAACHPATDTGAPSDDDPGDGHSDTPPGPTCAAPTLTAPFTAEGASAVLVGLRRAPGAGPAGRNELRPVVVSATGRGSVTVSLEGDFLVSDERGRPVTLPLTVAVDDLPHTLLLGADVQGTGVLRAEPVEPDEACPPVALALGTHRWHDLAAHVLPRAPGHLVVDLFRHDEPVDVVLDGHLLPDRAGLPADVWIVEHRLPSAWVDDPTLVDVGDGPDPVTFPAVDATTSVHAWAPPLAVGDGPPPAYDVVVDFGRDGRLDPGDLVDGFGRDPGFHVVGDLSRPGPYTPRMERIASSPPIELWWPTDVPAEEGPRPLVMMAHGNGHDYRWYGFLGEHLASWGFVFASHVNNTDPGILTASTSTLNATNWMVNHEDDAVGGALAGLIDTSRIAWIGHSRGGEGVVRAYQRLAGNIAPVPTGLSYTADAVRAAISIGPTVFDGVVKSNPGTVPYLVLVGGADGDVTGGADCALCQSFRLSAAAEGPVSTIYVHGAAHNVFHDGWAMSPGSWDDGVGPDQVGVDLVHPAEEAWLLAWLSWHLLGEDAYREVFTRTASDFRPPGVPDTLELAVGFRDALDAPVLVLDHFETEPTPEVSSGGGAVTAAGLELSEGVCDDGNLGFGWGDQGGDAMNGMTLVSGGSAGEKAGVLGWTGDASWTVALTQPTDVRGYGWLTLTAAQTTRHPYTVAHGGPLGFAVELADADGHVSLLDTDAVGVISDVYARGGLGDGLGWQNEWNTVRIPIRAFVTADSGLDPSRITSVTLRFGEAHGAATGRIGLDDVALVP
jgi:hypothetical protein